MSAGMSPVIGRLVHMSLPRLTVLAVVLFSSFSEIYALPALPLAPSPSLTQVNTSSPLTLPYPRPPEDPTCPDSPGWDISIGQPSYSDCDYILSNLYPKDPLAKPVMRNFYTAPGDASHTLKNFKLPYEQSYSIVSPASRFGKPSSLILVFVTETCNVQLILATNFNNVPHDEATFNDLRGAARTIFRKCLLGKNLGGMVTKNGRVLQP